jgi:hypothetical protein
MLKPTDCLLLENKFERYTDGIATLHQRSAMNSAVETNKGYMQVRDRLLVQA